MYPTMLIAYDATQEAADGLALTPAATRAMSSVETMPTGRPVCGEATIRWAVPCSAINRGLAS